MRPVTKRNRLPCESGLAQPPPPPPPPLGIRHLKFFIDLYYDDFGAFGKAYHKLGGLYIQFGNMPFSLRKRLKNHFLIGLVPFGASFAEFIKPLINDIKQLQEGIKITDCNGEQVFVSGGLGMSTADLPQGNDMAGVRRHNADHGCRSCEVFREDLNNLYFDVQANGRYQHLSDQQFKEIRRAPTNAAKEAIAKRYGLQHHPNILDRVIRN